MPKINVYLPDGPASAVKVAGVPVSAVCQAALSDAVERVGGTRQAIELLRDPSAPGGALARLAEGWRRRMTPRLLAVLQIAGSISDKRNDSSVTSLDLLGGLLEDGENLGVRLLVAQCIDVDALRESSMTRSPEETASSLEERGATLPARLSMPARAACASALEAVVELGHNYFGCEHLLMGLARSDGAAGDLVADTGLRADSLRQTLNGAIAGVVHERSASSVEGTPGLDDLLRRFEAIERRLAESSRT